MSPEVTKALQSLGQPSLVAWAEKFPTASMNELAGKLPVRVAPIALVLAMAEEAHRRGTFASFARSWMVRVLNTDSDSGTWGYIFDDANSASGSELWRRAEAARKADPDWLPKHKDEPRLVALFAGVELARTPREQAMMTAFDRIAEVCRGRRNKAALDALAQLPPGFGYLFAVRWVDAEVRNGGFEQLYRNSRGVELPLAITGLGLMKRDDLAAVARESLGYAKLVHPELLDDSVDAPTLPAARPWGQLDKAYYAVARDDLSEDFAAFVESRPELFDPPFQQVRHPGDGRLWKARACGPTVEIQIVLDDGTAITRERKQASPAAAQRELQRLVEEQLSEGFVRVK